MPMKLVFDPLMWEYEEFKMSLEHLLRPVHEAATIELQKIHSENEDSIEQLMHQAEAEDNEGEWQFQADLKKIEKEMAQDREILMGWLALIYAVSLFHLKLNKLMGLLESSHPSRPHDYKGKSWLARVSDEFKQRFRVDLETHQDFPYLKQLVLARNDVEHDGGRPTESCLKFANPKFVGKVERVHSLGESEQDIIVFSNRDLVECIAVMERYMEWVVRELVWAKSGRRYEGPLQGTRFVH